MSDSKHVDELTMMRFAESELAYDREDVTRAHLIDCARCRASYEALKAETELLRASVLQHDEALPDHIRPRHADVSWVLVAMLVFGTLGVSSLWTRYVAPMFDSMENVGVDGTSVVTTILIRSLLWRGWSDMLSQFVQGAVLVVVLAIAGYLSYWFWRRFRSSVAVLSALLGIGGAAFPSAPAEAAVIELDAEIYTVREGEVIETDLIFAGKEIRIEGTVVGDLIAAANLIQVVGEVQGDVLGFAETIEITGRVGGNVRTGSRRLEVEGTVARNVTSAGETLRFSRAATLGGSVMAAARETIFDAAVPRDIIVAGRTTEIHARIGGSALVAGEELRVGPDGAIGGSATYYGPEEPDVDPQAELASPIDYERLEEDEHDHPVASWATGFFYFWTAAFLFGAAVMLLLPETSEVIVTKHVPDYGKSFVHGVLSAVILTAFGFLVTLTLVGAPLGLTTLVLLGIGLYVAQVFVAAYIGREVLGTPTSASEGIVRLALGLLLIQLAKAVPILGFVVLVVVALWGLGAISAYVQDKLRPTAKPVEAEI